MNIRKYTLEITVFLSGAIVMIFEIVGSRVLGPYFGTSIFVWTSLIGIVLGGLSFGYYLGGKVADKKANLKTLSLIILNAAILIGLTTIIKHPLLLFLQNSFLNNRIGLILASLLLFFPVSILLGMVSPYAAKLKLINLKTSGETIGNLYALSTMGSIGGTFLAGFYLIPKLGTSNLLFALSMILIVLSVFISEKKFFKTKVGALVFFLIALFALSTINKLARENELIIDTDTTYSRVLIYNDKDKKSEREVRLMKTDTSNQSAMFIDSEELANEYTKYYDLAKFFKPDFKKTLMFGGAGYSYPKHFLNKYPQATIDVVEIDPGVTDLARKYFKLEDSLRLNIYHTDGRVYLNETNEKYDVIFGDAFSSSVSIPYHLTTKEAVQKKYDILSDDGVSIINIISTIEGSQGKFLRAEYKTFKSVFPQVYLFPVNHPNDAYRVQNIMLVALKNSKSQKLSSDDFEINRYLEHVWEKEVSDDMPILTDDYAPVNHYTSKIF